MAAADAPIEAAAQQCLDDNLSLPVGRVFVHVVDGWITLTGLLNWDFQKAAAEHGLAGIPGVRGLTNLITIRPFLTNVQPDAK